jgi:hypothetical protein
MLLRSDISHLRFLRFALFAIFCSILFPSLSPAQSYWNPKADSLLLAWYTLDTTAWTDSISGSNATQNSAPSFGTDAMRGSAPNLTGNRYFTTVNTTLLNNYTAATIMSWLKITTTISYAGFLMSRVTTTNHQGITFSEYSTSKYIEGRVNVPGYAGAGTYSHDAIVYPYTVNQWYHCGYTWDQAKWGARPVIFANGRNLGYGGGTVTAAALKQNEAYYIGTDRTDLSGRSMRGYIDEVMIWGRALSSTEMMMVYIGTWQKLHTGWTNPSRANRCQPRARLEAQ